MYIYRPCTSTPSDGPVAKQRAEDHERVLHGADNLSCAVASEEELSAILEVTKRELLTVPLSDHLLQLRFDVLLLHG